MTWQQIRTFVFVVPDRFLKHIHTQDFVLLKRILIFTAKIWWVSIWTSILQLPSITSSMYVNLQYLTFFWRDNYHSILGGSSHSFVGKGIKGMDWNLAEGDVSSKRVHCDPEVVGIHTHRMANTTHARVEPILGKHQTFFNHTTSCFVSEHIQKWWRHSVKQTAVLWHFFSKVLWSQKISKVLQKTSCFIGVNG